MNASATTEHAQRMVAVAFDSAKAPLEICSGWLVPVTQLGARHPIQRLASVHSLPSSLASLNSLQVSKQP